MAKITHDISSPNDGLGDALREAFDNQNEMNTELYDTKVDKVLGKDLSANDFTDELKDKLDSMDLDAQVNVQADWFQEDIEADDYIKNKPDYLNSVGSFLYADLATQTTPLDVVATVALKITNDTLGDETNVSNAPYGVASMFDEATNQFYFGDLSVGDLVTFNLDAYFTTTNTDQTYSYYLYMGIGSGNERIKYLNDSHKKPIGQLKYGGQVSFTIENEDMRDYPAELYILSNHNGTLIVNGFYLNVIRKNINVTMIEVDVADELALKAPLANPTFTGSVVIPDGVEADEAVNKGQLDAVATTKNYNTYYINTATGNNATGVFEDASKPFANIDYVTALPSYAGGVFELQNAGTFVINDIIPDFDIAIRSNKSCTLDFSANTNTNLIPTASTTKNYEINLPFGIVRNEKSGASGSCFNSLGTGNIIFKAKELYSNQSNNFINYFGSTIFEVEKVSGREPILATVDSSTQKSCNDIEIKQFICLASNSCLISGAGSTVSISIGLISGTGNYRFSGGRYTIGNITTTGTTSNGSTSSNFLHLNFKNSTITSSGGIELGNRNVSTTGVIITGNIASCPLIFATAVTNVSYNSYFTKFINFSANFGTGTYNQNHGNVIFENCSIKSTNSPITLGSGTTYNSSVEIKNSTFEVVNAVPLVTGGASSGDTLKIAGVSTNATMLSDQNGTGVTVTQFTNY